MAEKEISLECWCTFPLVHSSFRLSLSHPCYQHSFDATYIQFCLLRFTLTNRLAPFLCFCFLLSFSPTGTSEEYSAAGSRKPMADQLSSSLSYLNFCSNIKVRRQYSLDLTKECDIVFLRQLHRNYWSSVLGQSAPNNSILLS